MRIDRKIATAERNARKSRMAEKVGENRANLIVQFEDVIAKGLRKDATGRNVMQCLTAALTGFIRSRPQSEHVRHVDYVAGKILSIVPQTAPPEILEAMDPSIIRLRSTPEEIAKHVLSNLGDARDDDDILSTVVLAVKYAQIGEGGDDAVAEGSGPVDDEPAGKGAHADAA